VTQPGLLRFLRLLATSADVEDLAQETYLRAMAALLRFDARSTARTWLYAIARHVAADHVRLAQRRPRTGPLSAADDAEVREFGAQFDETVVLRGLLEGLDPDRREAFVLTQVLGFSYEEAAQVCDCPVGTIRSRVSRARDDLIAAMRADEDTPSRSSTVARGGRSGRASGRDRSRRHEAS
jgi:RNA polymerase sigma-70 factor (ECF subfamily)